MSESPRDEILESLKDAWGLEKNCVEMMRGAAEQVSDPTLHAMLARHADVCHTCEEMLEARIRGLGDEPSSIAGFFSKAASTFTGWMQSMQGRGGRDNDVAIRDYVMLASRAATYRSLEARAFVMGDSETSAMARAWSEQAGTLMDESLGVVGRVAAGGRPLQPDLQPDRELHPSHGPLGEMRDSPQDRPPSPPML